MRSVAENYINMKCETQRRNLQHIKWCCTKKTDGFWQEVSSYKDVHRQNPFPKLATLDMTVRSLPFSNAGIERCFSDMSIVKCRRRNRLDIDTLNAILSVQDGLQRHKKSATNIACQMAWLQKSARWHPIQQQRMLTCKTQEINIVLRHRCRVGHALSGC